MSLVSMRGEMWARNSKNIEAIPGSKSGGKGIYILYDGSMPVYVGKGNIRQRIREARKSRRRGQQLGTLQLVCTPQCGSVPRDRSPAPSHAAFLSPNSQSSTGQIEWCQEIP